MTDEVQQEVDYEFVIRKLKDGNTVIGAVSEETTPPSINDIYAQICLMKQNIETQLAASAIQQAMIEAAMQVQGQTKSGLVVPPQGSHGARGQKVKK